MGHDLVGEFLYLARFSLVSWLFTIAGVMMVVSYALAPRVAEAREKAPNPVKYTTEDQARNLMVGQSASVRSRRSRKMPDPHWKCFGCGGRI